MKAKFKINLLYKNKNKNVFSQIREEGSTGEDSLLSPTPDILGVLPVLSHLATNTHTQHDGDSVGAAGVEPRLGQHFAHF